MKTIFLSILLFSASFFFSQEKLPLIPYPQNLEIKEGKFYLNNNIEIFADKNSFEAKILKTYLENEFKSNVIIDKKYFEGTIIVLAKDKNLQLNSHKISIRGPEILILAKDNKDIFYGIQTLLQLFEIYKEKREIPNLEIQDYPKFEYRGMHLDVARHFFTVEEVKKYIDYLTMYKYNTFHWHLTDDQGWRIEIKKYPKLTEIGAWRNGSQVGAYSDMKFDDKKYGGFYTQEQIKEVVKYAKERHINVVPEIEMPGHAVAILASYPELSCLKGPFEVSKKWGVEDNILCPKEETFKFLEGVIDEVVELFPYDYIHIGGDEAPKKVWKESEYCQNLIKKLGLKDEHELQSYFITRMEKYINKKGKQIIGWNEILEGGLAPNATVMSWTGIEGGIQAAKTKHKAIMTPTSTNYFDYYQGNPETEPISIGGDLRLNKVYQYNPIPEALNEEEAKYIWGTQGNLWTEYILDFPHVEHMIFPRMMALSEVAWGTSNPKDYKGFEKRVTEHFKILDKLGIHYSKAIFEVSGKIEADKDGNIFYELTSAKPNEFIHFTTDGTEPTSNSPSYSQPLKIEKSMVVKSATFENNEKISATITQEFAYSKSTGKKIELQFPPSEAYSVGGESALVNAVKGHEKNHGKNWLGFGGKDCVATIDFGTKTEFSQLNFNAYDRQGSWIYLPKSAIISVSNDGINFNEITRISSEEITKSGGKISINFTKQNSKFIKIEIQNYGIIPDGKEGAGNSAWLFVDEISVN